MADGEGCETIVNNVSCYSKVYCCKQYISSGLVALLLEGCNQKTGNEMFYKIQINHTSRVLSLLKGGEAE